MFLHPRVSIAVVIKTSYICAFGCHVMLVMWTEISILMYGKEHIKFKLCSFVRRSYTVLYKISKSDNYLHIHPSVWKNPATTGQSLMKFHTWVFSEKLEVRHSRCVIKYNVESECENSHKYNYIWYLIASDGGWLATTTCFGQQGGHRQVVHTKVRGIFEK